MMINGVHVPDDELLSDYPSEAVQIITQTSPTPQPGQRVWVEAVVEAVGEEGVCVNVKTLRARQYGIDIQVPLSSVRLVKGGE